MKVMMMTMMMAMVMMTMVMITTWMLPISTRGGGGGTVKNFFQSERKESQVVVESLVTTQSRMQTIRNILRYIHYSSGNITVQHGVIYKMVFQALF